MRLLALLFLAITSVSSDWSVTQTQTVQAGQTTELRCPMDHESCIWYSSTKEPLEGTVMTDDNGDEQCVIEVEGTEINRGEWICFATSSYKVELVLVVPVPPPPITFDELVSKVKNLTLENVQLIELVNSLSSAVQNNTDEIQRLREHLRSV